MKPRQTLQYLCSLCNTILKELDYLIDPKNVSEPCPNCGYPLSSTLTINRPHSPVEQITFKSAQARTLTFDLEPLDSFYHGIRVGDVFYMTGRVSSLVSRLCVRSLLPSRLGGLASNVLVIDAGNTSDAYQCVSFARQYGMNISKLLGGIVVSRVFTIHQLAALTIVELPEAIKRFRVSMVVISGLLTMFLQDPRVNMYEAKRLLRQMMMTTRQISKDVIIVMAAQSIFGYEDMFDKLENRIDIRGSDSLQIMLSSPYSSKMITLSERTLARSGV